MPTGYTAPLYEGKDISFEQFALRCSRAMGAAVMQRDESLEVEIRLREVDDYRIEAVEKARLELAEGFARSDDEWSEMQDRKIREAITFRDQDARRSRMLRARYEGMLAEVKTWTPPSVEHEGLKKFMIEQLEESIRFDCGGHPLSAPEWIPVGEYRDKKMEALSERLRRALSDLKEERERVASQNKWVTALLESLAVDPLPVP